MRFFKSPIILILFFSFPLHATTPQEHVALAEQFHKQNELEKAIEHYQLALSKDEKLNTDIYFKLGIAYFDQAAWDKAIDTFEKCTHSSNTYDQQALYFIGLSYYAKRNHSESEKAFKKAIEIDTVPALTASAKSYLDRLKNTKDKNWSTMTALGYAYDSNLTIETTTGILSDPKVTDEVSSSNSFLLKPTYQKLLGRTDRFSGSYLFYTQINWNRQQKTYDIYRQQLEGQLESKWSHDHNLSFILKGLGEAAFTGSEKEGSKGIHLLGAHEDAYLTHIFPLRPQWSLNFPLHIGLYDFKSGQGTEDRDSILYETGLETTFINQDKTASLNGGYRFSYDRTNGTNFRSRNHKFLLTASHPLLWDILFSGQATYTRKFFPINDNDRRDGEKVWSINFLKSFGSFSPVASVTHIENNSNLKRYKYKRWLGSLTAGYSF